MLRALNKVVNMHSSQFKFAGLLALARAHECEIQPFLQIFDVFWRLLKLVTYPAGANSSRIPFRENDREDRKSDGCTRSAPRCQSC